MSCLPLILRRRRFSGSDAYAVLGYKPPLVFDFAEEYYRANSAATTFAGALTFARASSATYVDSTGTIQTASSGVARVGHHIWNGTSWVNEGLLLESEARTNLLHTTDALVTQSLTVTAVPHTLHFTGTGTVTLLGASTAGPLVGTGTGENNRVSLTFTPTAAILTLTVTGTVTNAQLEVASTPSSYIPNLAASGSVTRAAETLTIPNANLPWPTPNVIGPELVTNGDFSSATGWTLEGGWAIASGTLNWTGSYNRAAFPAGTGAFESGKAYLVTGTVSGYTSGKVNAYLALSGNPVVALLPLPNANGDFSIILVPTATVNEFGLTGNDVSGARSIDNISVREIDPLAVSIQMQGRATGDTYTTTRWYADANNYITQEIGASDFTFEQAAFGTVDPVTGGSFTSGVNTSFNIASRHGSTFINGAVGGTALTVDLSPTALPDLSATNLNLGQTYMGTIKQLRMWAADLGDTGIEEASA